MKKTVQVEVVGFERVNDQTTKVLAKSVDQESKPFDCFFEVPTSALQSIPIGSLYEIELEE